MEISKILDEFYDNIFKFNDTDILVLFDKDSNVWLSYNSILKSLGYTDLKKLKKRLAINDEYFDSYENIYSQSKLNKTKNEYQKPNEKFINESGIYLLLSRSSKHSAKDLSKILFTEVLTDLRKKGRYILSKNDSRIMTKLTQKIKKYQKELKLTQKLSFRDETENGFIYVLKIKTHHNGNNKICYKIGYTSNLEKRLSTYKTGNPNIELVHQENLKCNKKQLEKCVISLNTLKLLKNKAEIICNVSLEKIKAEISDCKKLLEKYK